MQRKAKKVPNKEKSIYGNKKRRERIKKSFLDDDQDRCCRRLAPPFKFQPLPSCHPPCRCSMCEIDWVCSSVTRWLYFYAQYLAIYSNQNLSNSKKLAKI